MRLPVSFISVAIIFLVAACKEQPPLANFYLDADAYEVGDTVFFHSSCQNASSFHWDFGDGTGSSDEQPSHVYTAEGEYKVHLMVSNKDGSDEAEKALTILPGSPCWDKLADINEARNTHIMVTLNDKIYAIGGSFGVGSVEEYDPVSDSWTIISDLPTDRGWLFGCTLDGTIYTMGGESWIPMQGWKMQSTVEAYDPATDTWTEKAPMTHPRFWGSAVALDGKIYVIGGAFDDPITDICETMEIYDPESDSWTEEVIPIEPRFESSVRVVEGKIYVIGGHTMAGEVSKVDIYDPVLNEWTSGTAMPTRRWMAADAVVNDKIYVIGGGGLYSWNESVKEAHQKVEIYDPATDSWEEGSPMPVARGGFEACVWQNRIYTSGGAYLTAQPAYSDCYVYDPQCDGALNK